MDAALPRGASPPIKNSSGRITAGRSRPGVPVIYAACPGPPLPPNSSLADVLAIAGHRRARATSVSQFLSHSPLSAAVHRPPRHEAAQVTDGGGQSRTAVNSLGKRVGGNPSRVRISHPPPRDLR